LYNFGGKQKDREKENRKIATMIQAALDAEDHVKYDSNGGLSTEPLPIVIAGGGCVGLFLALLISQSDIPNKVIVRF